MDMIWSEYWREFRKTTGRLTWRLATSADLPAIRRLRNVSERFLQQPQRNPSLFDLPVLLALVAENEKGKIVDAVYLEIQVELIKMACTRSGAEEGLALEEDIALWLKSIGFKSVLATTSVGLKERMTPILEKLGFRPVPPSLSYWKRRL
jgi:hypothetical protein